MDTNKLIEIVQHKIQDNPYNYQLVSDYFELLRILEDEGNVKRAHTLNKQVQSLTAKGVSHPDLDLGVKFYELHKRSLLFSAQVDFDSYMQYVEFDRDPEKRFYLPRRRFIQPMVKGLQDIADDVLDLLTISTPPGVGKSTLGIFFLSWMMGRFPDKPNLASAHSGKLTRSFYDGVLAILTDPEYLWSDVFPGIQIVSTNSKDESIDLRSPKRFKTLTCRSIDGSLTGATRCENILYADDLVSGIEEALSIARLDSLWQKYTNDLKSRRKAMCKEVHIATRWSVHDVIGRLERQYKDDPRARFVVMPALDENDESNFDYDYGVGFSTKYFLDMRDTLDEVSWRCLFMNEPIEREGLLYHVDELRRYFELPAEEPDAIVAICDTKDVGDNYCFLPIGYMYGEDVYIADCICDNRLPEVVDPRCAEILIRHNVKQCQFESNSAGGRTADVVQEMVRKHGGFTHITKKWTKSNKETRIIVNSSFVKAHFLFKDKSKVTPGSDYDKMLNFLTSYSFQGKNKWDDVPDGVGILAEYIQSLSRGKVEVFKRPF